MTLEELEAKAKKLMERKILVKSPNGVKGRITRLIPFKHTQGIDKIEITPIRDKSYFEEKIRLGDNWVCEVEEWCDMVFRAKVAD